MTWVAIDEQISVAVERSDARFSPTRVRLFIPGHTGVFDTSADLRRRGFPSQTAAAVAAVEELRAAHPTLLERWAEREGFL
jgi:hypothetical protein